MLVSLNYANFFKRFVPSSEELSQKYNLSIYNFYTISFLCTFVVILATYLIWLSRNKSHIPKVFENESKFKPRFRKRDKLMYYANQMEHKFFDLTDKIKRINSKDERTKLMVDYAKSILGLKKEEPVHNIMPHFPKSYLRLEEDEPTTMSHDLKLFSNALSVFGQIDYITSVQLFDKVEGKTLRKNEYLFRESDPIKSIYIIKSGSINIIVKEEDNEQFIISEATKGESIQSLLVCPLALIEKTFTYNSVMAQASAYSEVMCLPIKCFAEAFDKIQMARIIQTLSVKFQQTTNLAFNRYLNLNSELFSQSRKPMLEDSCISSLGTMIHEVKKTEVFKDDSMSETNSLKSVKTEAPTKQKVFRNLMKSDIRRIFKRKSNTTTQKSTSSCLNEILEAAQKDLTRILKLSESSKEYLSESLILAQFPKDSILDHPNDFQSGLIYVIDGEIKVSAVYSTPIKRFPNVTPIHQDYSLNESYSVYPEQVTGIFGLITGEPNYFQFTAKKDTLCALLPRNVFYKILKQSPDTLMAMYYLASGKMSDLFNQIYYSTQWVTVKAGKALYRTGEKSENMFIVLNGRLRQISVDPITNENTLLSELTKGHITGLEMLDSQKRLNTVMAIRDSECVRLPMNLIEWLKKKHPHVVNQLFQVLCSKLVEQSNCPIDRIPLTRPQTYMNIFDPNTISFARTAAEKEIKRGSQGQLEAIETNSTLPVWSKTLANLKTIAILPATPQINGDAFALELQHALSPHSSAIRLTSQILFQYMGPSALEPSQNYRFLSWLSHLEETRDILLLVCDPFKGSIWTEKCINQCDCILVLHHAADQHYATEETVVEKILSKNPTKTTKILVLMHNPDTLTPVIGQTVEWLKTRHWICQHYHIKCPSRVMKMISGDELDALYAQVFKKEKPNPLSDISRLARYLTGRAVGLVLGGGGARGCSHVGIIRVFQEVGIPIDMIGGTSIGAFMGALWARENVVHKFAQASRDFCKDFGSLWRKILDLTYPAVSFFTGSQFNNDVHKAIGDVQIEDLWLPYFNVTTDISNCKMRIHTNGIAWRYVRASMGYPVVTPPVCDPVDGNLLMDGVFVSNVPADVMASFGAKTIFAVDVGSSVDTNLTNYGDFISGWWYLWKTFFSGSNFRIPNMIEIQSRLAYVSCVKHLEQIKQSGICHYLRPPIEKYFTLQFNLFDEISDVGYQYGRKMIEEWSRDEKMCRDFTEIDVHLDNINQKTKIKDNQGIQVSKTPEFMKDVQVPDVKLLNKDSLDESEYPIIDLGDVMDEYDLNISKSPITAVGWKALDVETTDRYQKNSNRKRNQSFSIDYYSKSQSRNSSKDNPQPRPKLSTVLNEAREINIKNQRNNNNSLKTHQSLDEDSDYDQIKATKLSDFKYGSENELLMNSDPENINLDSMPVKSIRKRNRKLLQRTHSESRRKTSSTSKLRIGEFQTSQ